MKARVNRLNLAVLLALALAACSKQDIVQDLEEREANEILVLLDKHQLGVTKVPDVTSAGGGGNKGPRFKIVVPSSEANRAWKILTDNQLPRKKDSGYGEVFSSSGLIPTSSEERAKTMQAVTGELARTLKSIDGVLDARVHVVMPEDSVLRVKEEDKAETTASVWFKYVPRGGKPPVTEQQIAELVANSVEKLKAEKVKVIGTPAMAFDGAPEGQADGLGGPTVRLMGITMLQADANRFKAMIAGAVLLVVLATIGAMYGLLKASAARSVPMRRPSDGGPPAQG